jgi:hypothetical protein
VLRRRGVREGRLRLRRGVVRVQGCCCICNLARSLVGCYRAVFPPLSYGHECIALELAQNQLWRENREVQDLPTQPLEMRIFEMLG